MKKLIQKLKLFFDRVVKSLTKFKYYKEIEKANFKFSLKYLFVLFYFISLISSIIFAVSASIWFMPRIPQFVASFEKEANSLYPSDLVVTVKDGNISTNQKEPYSIDTLNKLNLNGDYEHFVTIDTSAEASDIKDKNTQILITKNEIVTLDDESYKVYPIDETANLVVDKNSVQALISQVSPYLKYIEPLAIIILIASVLLFPFIGAGLALIGQLIYLLIFTCILFVTAKIMKKNLEYKKLYQLSMHGSTLPILLTLVVSTLGITMPFLLGTAILLIFMILVLNQF